MFYLGGVGLSFFLTLLLFTKRNKTLADKILAAWLALVTLHLLTFYFRVKGLYPQTLGIEIPLPLVHGPLLYLYVRALTLGNLSSRLGWLHLALPVLSYLYLIPFFLLPVEDKVFIYQNEGIGYEVFTSISSAANVMSGVVYVILATLALRRHQKSIANQFSNTEKINLDWLQYLTYWITIIWVFVIAGIDEGIFGTAVLFIVFIGYFGIRQVGIFYSASPAEMIGSVKPMIEPIAETAMPEKKKYEKSGLNAESSAQLHRQLTELMNKEKTYCQAELSLAELADQLDTQPNYLSQVINELEGKSFYDYINTLRVEEFRRLAANPDSKKYTLLALAQRCGFNSKSSFNRHFKKVTGQLPSEFAQTASVVEK